ncbi:MAG: hypothetical protein ACPGYP_10535, partial [Solirubrobacterales bacterium]
MNGTIYALSNTQIGIIYRPSLVSNIAVKQSISASTITGGVRLATTNWPKTAYLFGFIPLSLDLASLDFDYQAKSGAANSGATIITNPAACGPATSELVATPYSGSTVTASSSYTVTGCGGDTEDPVVTITNPTDGDDFAVNSAVVNYTATDNVGVTSCNINDGDSVALTPGANAIVVTCSDAAGNSGSDTVNVTYTVPDTEDPVVTITNPTDGDDF